MMVTTCTITWLTRRRWPLVTVVGPREDYYIGEVLADVSVQCGDVSIARFPALFELDEDSNVQTLEDHAAGKTSSLAAAPSTTVDATKELLDNFQQASALQLVVEDGDVTAATAAVGPASEGAHPLHLDHLQNREQLVSLGIVFRPL